MPMKQFVQPSKELINGVIIKKCNTIPDDRGRLTEIIRCDDILLEKFGQCYLTTGYPNIVKAFHYHEKQTDVWHVIKGRIKLVLYDDRDQSPTKNMINILYMGEHNPITVKIPPKVIHGFKTVSQEEAYIINIPSEPYNYTDPDEFRIEPHGVIPHDWNKIDG